jgi:hypothetical protein
MINARNTTWTGHEDASGSTARPAVDVHSEQNPIALRTWSKIRRPNPI